MGLVGGLSWESSAEYYRLVNEGVRARRGGLHSARLLLYSFDFDEIERLQRDGRWDDATARMIAAAASLQRGGADFLVICSNTMHRMADEVQAAVPLPLVHIADATGAAVVREGNEPVGILASSDLNHYEDQRETLRKDQIAIDRILALDPRGLWSAVDEFDVSMCGFILCKKLSPVAGK